MKYIDNKTFEPTPGAATRYLNKLGIYDIESFLYKPKPSDYISPWSLNNMEEMVAALNEVFTKNKKIFLYNDIPEGMLFDEIEGFSPIILNGNISEVK